jgi:hypothetical protein
LLLLLLLLHHNLQEFAGYTNAIAFMLATCWTCALCKELDGMLGYLCFCHCRNHLILHAKHKDTA